MAIEDYVKVQLPLFANTGCNRCGCLVFDLEAHDAFHAEEDAEDADEAAEDSGITPDEL